MLNLSNFVSTLQGNLNILEGLGFFQCGFTRDSFEESMINIGSELSEPNAMFEIVQEPDGSYTAYYGGEVIGNNDDIPF